MTSSILRTRARLIVPVVYACAVYSLSVGCSEREDGPSRTATGPIGQAGQGGARSAGSGGASGASGASASAGAGVGGSTEVTPPLLPPAPMPAMCGDKTCTPPMGSRLSACCLPDNSCGLGTGGVCQEAEQPGALDPSCPSHEVTAASLTLPGCCKPVGKCGVMSASGLGCVERTALAPFAGGPLDEIACVPQADAEDAGVADGEEDAGVDSDTPEPVAGQGADAGVAASRCEMLPAWVRRMVPACS